MAVTPAQIDTLVEAANAAIDAHNWGTAQSKLMQAKAILATRPEGSQGAQSVVYDRRAIDELLKMVTRKMGAAQGIRRIPVERHALRGGLS